MRIAFDGNAVYMGVTCYDSEPDHWLGYETRRDQFLASDDRFMWMGEMQFTPFVALVNNIQFDTMSRVMGGNHDSDGS